MSQPTGSARRRLLLYLSVGSLARAANAGLPSAIILAVLAAGGSATEGSVLVAVLAAVAALIGPVVGAAIDRLDRPRQGYLAGILVLASASAALAVGVGRWSAAVLLLAAGLAGLAQPVLTGAWSAQLRRIVPDVASARAYALDVGTYNVAEIAGPALVGVAFVIDSQVPGAASLEAVLILYLLAALVLPLVPIPARGAGDPQPQPIWRMLSQLTVMWSSASLRRTTTISTVGFAAIAVIVVAAPLVGADLAGDPGVGALLLAVIALGALVGSLAVARSPIRRLGPGTVVVGSTLALAVLLAGLAASPTMAVAFVLGAIFGFAQAPQITAVFQVRDRESSATTRSLVFVTAASLRTGAFAVGSLLAGALAPQGWRVLIVIAAGLQVLAVVGGLVLAPRRTR